LAEARLRAIHRVEADFRPARKAHPALLVTGLADILARAREAGFEEVPDTDLECYRRSYLLDPFGNRLELMEAV